MLVARKLKVAWTMLEEDMYGMFRQNTHRDMYLVPGHSKIVLARGSAQDQINDCRFAAVWNLSQVMHASHL